jgi:hypothetical protein
LRGVGAEGSSSCASKNWRSGLCIETTSFSALEINILLDISRGFFVFEVHRFSNDKMEEGGSKKRHLDSPTINGPPKKQYFGLDNAAFSDSSAKVPSALGRQWPDPFEATSRGCNSSEISE